MGVRTDLEKGIVEYLKNHPDTPSEYGTPPRIGTDGDDMDISNIIQPFILVQLLDMRSDISVFQNLKRDVNFIAQLSCFNRTNTEQKELPENILNIYKI